MEGIERMSQPAPERDLESQKHRETPEEAERAEMLAAIKRTLSNDEQDLFYSIAEPGVAEEVRTSRKEAFNDLRAGTPDAEEVIEGRKHENVSINIAGTVLSVSRDDRGRFSVV